MAVSWCVVMESKMSKGCSRAVGKGRERYSFSFFRSFQPLPTNLGMVQPPLYQDLGDLIQRTYPVCFHDMLKLKITRSVHPQMVAPHFVWRNCWTVFYKNDVAHSRVRTIVMATLLWSTNQRRACIDCIIRGRGTRSCDEFEDVWHSIRVDHIPFQSYYSYLINCIVTNVIIAHETRSYIICIVSDSAV